MATKIQIVEIATQKVIKEHDISDKSDSYIEKLEMALYDRIDLDRYEIVTK